MIPILANENAARLWRVGGAVFTGNDTRGLVEHEHSNAIPISVLALRRTIRRRVELGRTQTSRSARPRENVSFPAHVVQVWRRIVDAAT